MGSIARIAVALLSAVAVQFVAAENRIVRRHHEDSANKRRFEVGTGHHLTFNDSESSPLRNLLGVDTFGIPFNETLHLLATDVNATAHSATKTSSLLKYLVYPLIAIANHKVNTLRNLLILPIRLVLAPIGVARSLWRTKEAIWNPVNATLLGRLHDDLSRLNITLARKGKQ